MPIMEIEQLTRTFGSVKALGPVNLSLEKGKQYALQGASGSGKSTLLHLMGGLDWPTGGTVKFQGRDLAGLSDTELAKYRNRQVGFVFQFHFLLPSLKALDNILLPCDIAGLPRKQILQKIEIQAQRLGLSHCLGHYPHELSGGEQQRISVLRAISLEPSLILCDEPTGNLDSENSQRVSSLLGEVALELGATLVVVTHNETLASHFEHNILMKDGRIASPDTLS